MPPMHQQQPTTQCHTCCHWHPSLPLRPRRQLTNTAACLLPPSRPNNTAVQALRRCCPDNAAACPPLPQPLSLPNATACHQRPASTIPTTPRRATVGNPPTPGESPACACCHPVYGTMPSPMQMSLTPMPTPMQKWRNGWKHEMDGSGDCNGWQQRYWD